MEVREPISRTYRFVMAVLAPVIRWWGRLEVAGEEHLPTAGPTLAGRQPRLVLGSGRDRHGGAQAPPDPGAREVDAVERPGPRPDPGPDGPGADRARQGRQSRARSRDRARSGAAAASAFSRRARSRAGSSCGPAAAPAGWRSAVPEAEIVSCTVTGTVDIVRFPKRPRIRVEFFAPEGGQLRDGEDAAALVGAADGRDPRAGADRAAGPQANCREVPAGGGGRGRSRDKTWPVVTWLRK